MPTIIYVHWDGSREALEVQAGTSVMQAAVGSGIVGIDAECGGNAMCATCHVYVDEDLLTLLAPVSDEEDALLEGTAAERRPNSRLSCQITVRPELDGLVVQLPERQV